ECASVTTSSVTPEERTRLVNFTVALHPDFPDQEVVIGGSLSDKGRTELCFVLKKNLDIFAWQPSNMTGVPRSVAEHRLNIREGYTPVRQKKRGQAPERARAIQAKVQKLVDAGIMREVYYHDCLSNPVMVKKHDESWRMCVDFTDLNRVYAYKGYHQIQLAEADEEKTAFHTGHGVYCYTKMPFGLKNAGAMYQRLMDKAFESQVGQNIEVYVDDLVVKSHTEAEMVSFQIGRKISAAVPDLKKCIKKSDFLWTAKAEQAFQQLKQRLLELPLLVAPNPQEELIMYLPATYGAVSAVLMTERGTTQTSIYFISRALQGPELNYSEIGSVMTRPDAAGRLQKWSIMLGEHNITYRLRTSVKGKILVDFLVEMPGDVSQAALVAAAQEEPWTLFTDGSSCVDGSRAGLILTNPEGVEFTYALSQSSAGNVCGKGRQYDKVPGNSQGPGQRIHHLLNKPKCVLPGDNKEARKLRLKARQYALMDGVLYRRSFLTPWLRCVGPLQADYVMREIHEGSCSTPPVTRHPQQPLTPITALWPFYKWGINIACPFPEGPGKVKFLIVAMDYFTKWVEAKAVATITDGQVEKFVWDNIVCRFDIPGEIISDNGKQFADNPFKDCLGEGIKARLGEGNKNWVEELPHVLWAYRTMIKSSHGDTPFSLTYGTEAVIPAEIGMPTYRIAAVDVVNNDKELRLNLDLLEERRERAAVCEARAKSNMMKYYNARVRGVTFKPGDFLYRSNDASHTVAGGKLGPKWEGPYEVIEALGNEAYKLRCSDGTVLPRTWNVTNLNRCYL
nr:reverse transcriptase domain-containing protein [Tanacetum cinerariifolium]